MTQISADAPENVTIRQARPPDAEAMRQVARLAYGRYVSRIGREPAPMTCDYAAIIATGCGWAWVAEEARGIVGLLVLVPFDDHLLLENVAILPDRQGAGLGARLLHVAEDQARAAELPEIRLYTNEAMTENLTYYPRHGYHQTHHAVQDGYRRVFFTKTITP